MPHAGPRDTAQHETGISDTRAETRRLRKILRAACEEAQQAREAEAWLRSLLDHVPVTIVTLDRDGTILSINRTLSGQPVDNVVGTCCLDYVSEAIREDCRQAIKEAFESGHSRRYECGKADPSGRLWEAVFTPVPIQGTVSVGVVIMQDVTERKRAEEEARDRAVESAHVHRVNMMGEMVAELAHEIGQPLYAISNFAQAGVQVLRSGQEGRGADLLAWLERISEQATRAGDIIRRLGNLMRKGQPDRVPVDLNRLIPNVIELTRPRARSEQIEITFHPTDVLPEVVVDPVQIEQVIVNLVQNAIEAMVTSQATTRQIDVSTSCLDGHQVEVAVHDTAGTLPDDLDMLFEAFYTTKPRGMGMGLAICRSIVEGHGGQIEAVRDTEGGTTLRFRLPALPGEDS
ncbi:MAG: PAS domain S-box protein [Pirellulales bacterium]|nr:PAS domain S-box protein [Pirellulales bacterium]